MWAQGIWVRPHIQIRPTQCPAAAFYHRRCVLAQPIPIKGHTQCSAAARDSWETHKQSCQTKQAQDVQEALALVMETLDDPSFSVACSNGRQTWVDQAVHTPITLEGTGTCVHVLGIVHDAPGNIHDIVRTAQAVQPDLVALETLPCQAHSYAAAALRLAPILGHLAQSSMHPGARTRRTLAQADLQGEYVAEAAQLEAQRRRRLRQAAGAQRYGEHWHGQSWPGRQGQSATPNIGTISQQYTGGYSTTDSARVVQEEDSTVVDEEDAYNETVRAALRHMLLTGCPLMTDELGAAHAAHLLGVQLRGVDMAAADLAELLRRFGVMAALERVLREAVVAGQRSADSAGQEGGGMQAGGRQNARSKAGLDCKRVGRAPGSDEGGVAWGQALLGNLQAIASAAGGGEAGEVVMAGMGCGGRRWGQIGREDGGWEDGNEDVLVRSQVAESQGDRKRAIELLLAALPPELSAAIAGDATKCTQGDGNLGGVVKQEEYVARATTVEEAQGREEQVLLALLDDKGIDVRRVLEVQDLARDVLASVEDAADVQLPHEAHVACSSPGQSEHDQPGKRGRVCRAAGDYQPAQTACSAVGQSESGRHGQQGRGSWCQGSEEQEEEADVPVNPLFAAAQARAPPEAVLQLLLACLHEQCTLALTPGDMHWLATAVPKLIDGVVIATRDRHMARRVAGLARGRHGGRPLGRVLLVVGRAHVPGVSSALAATRPLHGHDDVDRLQRMGKGREGVQDQGWSPLSRL